MGDHIHPAGWHNWNNADNEETAFYAEYMTHGADVTQRVSWSRQLTDAEAELYTVENIFDGEGGPWIPNGSAKLSGTWSLSIITLLATIMLTVTQR